MNPDSSGRRSRSRIAWTITALFFLAGVPSVAAAYVDPVSGSIVFQVLAAGVLGALLTIRHWFSSARAAARSLWLRLRRM